LEHRTRINDICSDLFLSLHRHEEPDSARYYLAADSELQPKLGQMVLEQFSSWRPSFKIVFADIPSAGIDDVLMRNDGFHPVFVKDALQNHIGLN